MRLVSWNVNGLRACIRKGGWEVISAMPWDVLGLQEVRARPEQLPAHVVNPPAGWAHIVAGERRGYSGVALYARRPPDELYTSLDHEPFDREGRLQLARFGSLWVANVYFPNGTGKTLPNGQRSNDRVPFKLAFYRRLFDRLADLLRRGERVVVMGDFNTAHRPIDLARPRDNERTSGFLPEERAELDRWLAAGWVDAFRHVHGDIPGCYTWWAQRARCRERNVGWRIDYTLVSPALVPTIARASIHPEIAGSDHCPISLDLELDPFDRSS